MARSRIELPRDESAGSLARRFLDERFAADLDELAHANARIVVSELVTNALLHGEGRIVLHAGLDGGVLRLEVVDEGTGNVPAIRKQPEGGVGGWGLRIVDTLAYRWGAFEGTTHVWAELPV